MDEEGHRKLTLRKIIDYQRDSDVFHKDDAFVVTHTAIRQQNITTKGWQICVCWNDGPKDWIELKNIKQSYPNELSDFVQLNDIHEEPAFAWWVP